jgi:alpha-1,2-mannosyltransferase
MDRARPTPRGDMLLRCLAERWLCPEMARFTAVCVLLLAVASGAAMFEADRSGRAGPSPTLGADYVGLYMIGTLQDEGGIARLYDLDLQDRILHRIARGLRPDQHLPFVYPPLLAAVFRPLARLPYATSFGVWLAIATSLYVASLAMMFRACPAIPRGDLALAWLLAMSFEPFAFECGLGGQVSVIGCIGVAAALANHRRGRPALAGACLALLSYKPPLLLLILPMLAIGRQWRTLAGFSAGAMALVITSLAIAGPERNGECLGLMTNWGRAGGSMSTVHKTIKYVDLGAFLKLLGITPTLVRPLALALSAPALAALALAWRRAASGSPAAGDLVRAATLCWTPVLNIYGPIYDVTIVVPGLILAADAIRRDDSRGWPTGFIAILAALYATALASPMAAAFGVQSLTLGLCAAAAYLTRAAIRA